MLHYDRFGRVFEVSEVGGRFTVTEGGCIFMADTLVGLMGKVREWDLFSARTINYKEL